MSNENSEVFAAMGSALTRWSIVDNNLTILYGVAVNPRKPTMAASSIWRVTGHNLKVEMTDAALQSAMTEYPKGDPEPVIAAWKKAKRSMKKAAIGRNDLGHSALYGLETNGVRKSVLQKDREKFQALRKGTVDVRSFDAKDCRRIELLCFDAAVDLSRVFAPLDEFFRASRIVMREHEANSREPFFDPETISRRRRERIKRRKQV